MKGYVKMAIILLNHGASKYLKNSEEKSPEQVAIDNNHEDFAQLMNELFQNGR